MQITQLNELIYIYQEIYMKIYIKPEQLTYFLELVGYDKIDKWNLNISKL